MPDEQARAALSKLRGQAAANISDPDEKKKFISRQGDTEKKGATASDYDSMQKEAENTIALGGSTKDVKPLGSYAKGTPSVPKTGVYKIHEGEAVVPKDKKSSHYTPAERAHFHRAMSHLHQGGLHDHFGMSHDEPIPMDKKQEAANSDNPHVAAMGRMAVAMSGWKHHGHHPKD
jgi:hypothetical protein